MAAKYKLNNWAIITYGSPYTAPECRRQCLIGETKDHPEWEDGHSIVTSGLRGRYGELVVTGSGSFVELGEPSANYEASFPEAKKRLLESLSELKLEAVAS